jgi:hypothetical protein
MKRLLNGVLGELILMLIVCGIALLCVEIVPNISIKAMLRLFFLSCIVLELLTMIWITIMARKKFPNDWMSLIYPEK